MKKRLYVDFHILQTVPPSCINRDDTGSPKTAVYGGVTRARVSSQAWKHAMRAAFAENAQLDVGKRTKKAAELVRRRSLHWPRNWMRTSWQKKRWRMRASRATIRAPRHCSS